MVRDYCALGLRRGAHPGRQVDWTYPSLGMGVGTPPGRPSLWRLCPRAAVSEEAVWCRNPPPPPAPRRLRAICQLVKPGVALCQAARSDINTFISLAVGWQLGLFQVTCLHLGK